MFCENCENATICEKRESWIFSDQFAQCEQKGSPDYCDDNYFIYMTVKPLEEETTMAQPEETKKDTNKSTTKRGTCTNCKRPDMAIVSGGLDWPCYKAAKGLSGEARERALREVKERIGSGNLRIGRGNRVRAQAAAGEAVVTLCEVREATIVPVNVQLTLDITVRVNGVVAG